MSRWLNMRESKPGTVPALKSSTVTRGMRPTISSQYCSVKTPQSQEFCCFGTSGLSSGSPFESRASTPEPTSSVASSAPSADSAASLAPVPRTRLADLAYSWKSHELRLAATSRASCMSSESM